VRLGFVRLIVGAYDKRDKPFGLFVCEPHHADNRQILCWWTATHDRLLAELVERWQWYWGWFAQEAVTEITPPDTLEKWKRKDPLCAQYAWYMVLGQFCVARAERLGYTKSIADAEWRLCPLCGQRFVENSLPVSLIKRLGIDHLDFCAPCLRDTVLQNSGDASASRECMLTYLRDLAATIERVPAQSFGEGMSDLLDMDTATRLELLRLLRHKPTAGRVKEVFGSWLDALIAASVLEDGARRTSRGIQTIAQDGHVCLSLGERTIDDWLYSHGIAHEKEPAYPEGQFRADWKVGSTFIEYFGLAGDPDYDSRTREKARICKKHGVVLVAVYAKHLASSGGLDKRLSSLLSASSNSREEPRV
jgi:hypothetical protein